MPRSALQSLSLTLSTVAVLALATGVHAFIETHLDEVAAPLGAYAADRVAEIDGLGSTTKAEKKERKLLAKLVKKESRTARSLRDDFSELLFGGKTAKKLKTAAAPMRDALDAAFVRAKLALGERREFVSDHLRLITDAKALAKIQKQLAKYDAARTSAAAAATDDVRAKALGKAEKALTKALTKAEKEAQKAANLDGTLRMPAIRLRSGDTVGSGGARIAVPADSNSPIAGSSVLIPPGALAALRKITIEPGDSFVGGRDVAAGPSVRLLPAGTEFNQPVRVSVPYTLPPDSDVADLGLFHNSGTAISGSLDVTLEENGMLTGTSTSFSEFQAGLLAPPLGAPAGTYHVELMSIFHRLNADGSAASSEVLNITGQEWSFRADGSGRSALGASVAVFRETLGPSPHHIDGYSETSAGSVDFAWEQIDQGRFSFTFPTLFGDTAVAEGIVSESGDVISFTARGGTFDFFAVGVRAGDPATAGDFEGRWVAVELGMQLLDNGQTDFRTRMFSSFTGFDVNADEGTLTYHDTGDTFSADRKFETSSSPAPHTRELNSVADGGTEDFSVLFSGQIGADSVPGQIGGAKFRRLGWLDPSRNVFLSHRGDVSTRSVSLMLAVRQPADVDPEIFQGDYRLARIDVAARVNTPATTSSTFEVDLGVGTFAVGADGNAALEMEAIERAAYRLTGSGPTTGMTWTSAVTLTDATPSPVGFPLVLDAGGNHRPVGTDRWYGTSGDGDLFLGATPGADDDGIRGIAIGLRQAASVE